MKTNKTSVIINVLGFLIAAPFVLLATMFVATLTVVMLFVWWAMGTPLTICVKDKKVGELKWFKYTKYS